MGPPSPSFRIVAVLLTVFVSWTSSVPVQSTLPDLDISSQPHRGVFMAAEKRLSIASPGDISPLKDNEESKSRDRTKLNPPETGSNAVQNQQHAVTQDQVENPAPTAQHFQAKNSVKQHHGNSATAEAHAMALPRGFHTTTNKETEAAVQRTEILVTESTSDSKPNESHLQDSMMMQMVFFGSGNMQLWFKNANVDSPGKWVASCLGLALLAALYEGLKVWRTLLENKYEITSYISSGHIIQTVLHLVQVTTSYFLMLAVMTYSTWVMISICAGAAVGYYLFAKFAPRTTMLASLSEHCH